MRFCFCSSTIENKIFPIKTEKRQLLRSEGAEVEERSAESTPMRA